MFSLMYALLLCVSGGGGGLDTLAQSYLVSFALNLIYLLSIHKGY